MKRKELKAALKGIAAVLNEPRVRPGHRNQLQSARRELESVARSGKVDRKKIFRSVQIVTSVLLEIVEDDAARRPR